MQVGQAEEGLKESAIVIHEKEIHREFVGQDLRYL